METKTKLHSAINEVMKEVKNIEKNLTVGDGKSSYKGVSDKDVKLAIGQSMAKHGLTCLMVDIIPTIKVERWTESTNYGDKVKQSVFTEVICKFKLTHSESGESEQIVGYGHGVDSQDKSAGKATTYALKNALLYSFLVPTGTIEDTDNSHSDQLPTAPPPKPQKTECDAKTFETIKQAIIDGKRTIKQAKEKFIFTAEQNVELLNLKNK